MNQISGRRYESRSFRTARPQRIGNFAGALFLSLASFLLTLPFGGEHPVARAILTLALIPTLWTVLDICASDRLDWVGLLANLYMAFGLIVPGIAQCAYGEFPFYHSQYPETDTTPAAIIVFVFCGSMLLGRSLSPTAPSSREARRYDVAPQTLTLLAIALAILAWVLALKLGLQNFIRFRGETSLVISNPINLLLTQISRSSSFAALLISIYAFTKSARGPTFIISALLCVGTFFVVNYPPALPRYFLLGYVLTLLFIFSPVKRSSLNKYIAFAYPFALSTLFPFLSYITRGNTRVAFATSWENYMVSSGDLDGFQSVVNVYRWIDADGPQFGKQLLSSIFAFVPRDIWEGKAAATGAVAAAANGYKFVNISAPLPAEFYSDFSWFGVLFGGLIVGWAVKRLDDLAYEADRARGRFSTVLTAALLAGFSAILFRGSLLAVLPPCALVVLIAQSLRFGERRVRT